MEQSLDRSIKLPYHDQWRYTTQLVESSQLLLQTTQPENIESVVFDISNKYLKCYISTSYPNLRKYILDQLSYYYQVLGDYFFEGTNYYKSNQYYLYHHELKAIADGFDIRSIESYLNQQTKKPSEPHYDPSYFVENFDYFYPDRIYEPTQEPYESNGSDDTNYDLQQTQQYYTNVETYIKICLDLKNLNVQSAIETKPITSVKQINQFLPLLFEAYNDVQSLLNFLSDNDYKIYQKQITATYYKVALEFANCSLTKKNKTRITQALKKNAKKILNNLYNLKLRFAPDKIMPEITELKEKLKIKRNTCPDGMHNNSTASIKW